MINTDPIMGAEKIVKDVNDGASKLTQPVLRRYPLLFSFLTVFSLAAILHGFELVVEKVPLFRNNPLYLIIIGTGTLLFTGTLYKILGKNNNIKA